MCLILTPRLSPVLQFPSKASDRPRRPGRLTCPRPCIIPHAEGPGLPPGSGVRPRPSSASPFVSSSSLSRSTPRRHQLVGEPRRGPNSGVCIGTYGTPGIALTEPSLEDRGAPCVASRPFPPPHPSCALGPNSAVTASPSCFPRLPPSSCPWPFKRFFLNRPGLEQRKRCKVSAGSGSEKSEAQGAAWGGKEAPAGTRQSRDPGRGVRLGLRAPGRRRGAPGARSARPDGQARKP